MFYVWSFCFFLVILHMDNKLEYAIYSGGVDTCVPMDIYHPQAACAISSFGIYYKLRIYLPYCFSGRTTILPLHRWKEPSPLYGCASWCWKASSHIAGQEMQQSESTPQRPQPWEWGFMQVSHPVWMGRQSSVNEPLIQYLWATHSVSLGEARLND